MALPELTPQLKEALALIRALDSLGDNPQTEDAGEVDDRAQELRFLPRTADAADERLLDLHDVQRQPAQVAQ